MKRLDTEVGLQRLGWMLDRGWRGWMDTEGGHRSRMQRLDADVGHRGWTQSLDAKDGQRGWTQRLDT